jgi:8-oxo-dGTP pyrophosphatase MutT (NUDIX family)
LPKGTPEAGETREQTALREVSEETGLEVVIRKYIGDIEYSFFLPGGERCHKTVYYYLMTHTGGDMSCHDSEFDDVQWFPAPNALETMTHQNEVRVVEKGLSMVAEQT